MVCHILAGAVPLLVLSVQEPELSLKAVAASALSDIAKHSPELAQAVRAKGTRRCIVPQSDLMLPAPGSKGWTGSACCAQVVDAGAINYLAPLLACQDAKLKRQVRRRGTREPAADHGVQSYLWELGDHVLGAFLGDGTWGLPSRHQHSILPSSRCPWRAGVQRPGPGRQAQRGFG